jgi:hypothetical protein
MTGNKNCILPHSLHHLETGLQLRTKYLTEMAATTYRNPCLEQVLDSISATVAETEQEILSYQTVTLFFHGFHFLIISDKYMS